MPLSQDKISPTFCKLLSSTQVSHFETCRFTELHFCPDNENGLTAAVPDVNVHWLMIVGVKEEAKAVLLENLRHLGRFGGDSTLSKHLCA